MELPDHVNVSKNLPDLISLTKVSVVAPDEILAILLRSLVWGSKQINDFERTDRCRIWKGFIILSNIMDLILSLQYIN